MDIFSAADILWAIATRVDPATDVTVIPDVRSHPMDPTAAEIGVRAERRWDEAADPSLNVVA